jgi:hypothetical protein
MSAVMPMRLSRSQRIPKRCGEKAYQALGGEMEVIIKPGIGHVHGLDDSTPIIEFIDRHRPGRD